jgi:hypothetical protein
MAEVILNCPRCQRQLRVPDTMFGTMVRCPSCGLTFTAPTDPNDPPTVTPVVEIPSAHPPIGMTHPAPLSQDHARARAILSPPAIALLIVGLLGLMVNCFRLARGITIPEESKALFKQLQVEPPAAEDVAKVIAAFTVVDVVVVLGAIQMLRARMYPLAITGTLLAMIEIASGCCCLGLPVGIWSLVVLLRGDVRALFYRLPSQPY